MVRSYLICIFIRNPGHCLTIGKAFSQKLQFLFYSNILSVVIHFVLEDVLSPKTAISKTEFDTETSLIVSQRSSLKTNEY